MPFLKFLICILFTLMLCLHPGCKMTEPPESSVHGKYIEVVDAEADFDNYKKQFEIREHTKLDQKPVPIKMVSPYYPVQLSRLVVEGYATLILVVNEEGKVEKIFLESASHEDFAIAAAIALRQWEFTKPTIKGEPVKAHFRQRIPFKLKKS